MTDRVDLILSKLGLAIPGRPFPKISFVSKDKTLYVTKGKGSKTFNTCW